MNSNKQTWESKLKSVLPVISGEWTQEHQDAVYSLFSTYREGVIERLEEMDSKIVDMPDHECGSAGYCEHYPVLDISKKTIREIKEAIKDMGV